ncbi:MAG TPA: beta-ketoacyl-ACP synthase 3 [Streptosporangiaceae bacterium]|nr:beta-ketoacyl-ACP synthase 3 [Streptosporangiaceae bacterium]
MKPGPDQRVTGQLGVLPPGRTGAALAGAGMSVPEQVRSNAAIAARLGVDEQWITRRTGTRERHVAAAGQRLDQFAAQAALAALAQSGLAAADVDAVLIGTTSAEEMSPHAAPLVAADIGAIGAAAIDVSAACTGFLSCLVMGAAMIEAGRARVVLAIGADMLTRYLDQDDPGSAMLFGDGAGAVVLTATDGVSGVGPAILSSDGSRRELIRLDRDELLIRMDGPTVYRHAVQLMSDVATRATSQAGLTIADIDLFVFHQANSRIIDAVGQRLSLDPDRVVDVVGSFANTSAASLPIALAAAHRAGRLHDGDHVLLAAFGAGLVWGGVVVTWGPVRR